MGKTCIVILMVIASVVTSGCSVNQEFVRAVDGYTEVILPEYKEYIKSDPTLGEDTKRIRIQSANKLQELVDEAKGE